LKKSLTDIGKILTFLIKSDIFKQAIKQAEPEIP